MHDLVDVCRGDTAVPDTFRVDDDGDAVLALIEAAGLIGAHATLQRVRLNEKLEARAHRARPLGGAAAARVARGALVLAHEDVALEVRHLASAAAPYQAGAQALNGHRQLQRQLVREALEYGMGWLLGTLVLVLVLSYLGRRLLGARVPLRAPSLTTAAHNPPTPEPIGDTLDLHGVPPRDVTPLVDAFLEVAWNGGRRHVRIVHGKGIGVVRRTVRVRLAQHPHVVAYGDAPPPSGWGATLVELGPAPPSVAPPRPSD